MFLIDSFSFAGTFNSRLRCRMEYISSSYSFSYRDALCFKISVDSTCLIWSLSCNSEKFQYNLNVKNYTCFLINDFQNLFLFNTKCFKCSLYLMYTDRELPA